MLSITQFLSDLLLIHEGSLSVWQGVVAIIIAYLGGILSSLTPCVYPMIPITISVVGGMGAEKRSWKEVCLRGTAYVMGMTVIYSFLGVIAGLSGKVFGAFKLQRCLKGPTSP
jgi:thiol:disulfide interchange protein DsbD